MADQTSHQIVVVIGTAVVPVGIRMIDIQSCLGQRWVA